MSTGYTPKLALEDTECDLVSSINGLGGAGLEPLVIDKSTVLGAVLQRDSLQ